MKIEYVRGYSEILGKDVECKIYGHAGQPILFIPCQDGRFVDFENFKMIDYFRPFIDDGRCMVFTIDTIDAETWSNKDGDPRWRAERYEAWIFYIVNEMVPFMQDIARASGFDVDNEGIMTYGASLGATHAAILYFRFPQIFKKTLALSGIYTVDFGFDGYVDDILYNNSPVHFLSNMPEDHEYVQMYRQNKGIICVGQGAWEQPEYTRNLQSITDRLGIPIWYDYWGFDCNHDWDWWYKQVEYFLPYLV
ncbi:MAG: alpha/beta hydrolase-fold protein [Firmicutes bacterium]|nr:alpha/beta hydrolase-fold protein [Bacillota bacterium]